MPNEQDAVSKFLNDTNESMFKNEDNFSDKVIEQDKIEEQKEEKPLPFHKDPKIQRYLDKREKEIEERIKSSLPKENLENNEDEFKDVIDSFTNIIGNDTPEKIQALKALEKSLKGFDEKAMRRAEEKINEIREEESRADKEAEEELQNAFENIEETYDVDLTSSKASKLRSEFATFVEKIAPKDREGNIVDYPDMESAWETFSEIKKSTAQPSRAKELASRSLSRSTEAQPAQPKKIDWNAVDEYMDTLKN